MIRFQRQGDSVPGRQLRRLLIRLRNPGQSLIERPLPPEGKPPDNRRLPELRQTDAPLQPGQMGPPFLFAVQSALEKGRGNPADRQSPLPGQSTDPLPVLPCQLKGAAIPDRTDFHPIQREFLRHVQSLGKLLI